MDQSLYPGLKNAASFLEVVDGRNTPLCIMAEKDVLRQRLRHRATALLIRDSAGRALLSFREGRGWGFSSFDMVRAGQSFEACARGMLQENWGEPGGRLLPLGLCPPCRESRQAFVALFEARLPAALAAQKALDPDRSMLLDYDELKGLGAHFGDLLSPFMRVAVQGGYVRPR
ncbi:NUDIX hydrolase [Desulfovibrio sp.]|uniref:NUDIX hydrolase n=1 Tax=Desulfovibrio sp. TaxID=885 RepID=UPI0025BF1F0C|nr:NUDIX hydrolase [Desulfovibrio sp.]